ncbi:50S ribosomal protein L19 [Candidatus Uhrbacteria bacterium]|nr:50S ribosomal protein L19 [Candidatus Uhrbacteria bacterium]
MSDEQSIQTPLEPTPAEESAIINTKLINFDELKAGQTVRVHERIVDVSPKGEERQRIQVFEGMVLGIRGAGVSRTFTIRKMSGTVAVEKIFPIQSPVIAKIELVKTARVRRAKLSFVSNLKNRFKRKLKETYVK